MVSVVARRLILWPCLAASFLIGLAGVVRMANPGADVREIRGVIRLPEQVTAAIVSLFTLAGLVFVAHVVRSGRLRRDFEDDEATTPPTRVPPWVRRLTQILSVLNFAILAYLIWRGSIPFTVFLFLAAGGGQLPDLGLGDQESAPAALTWTFGVLALAAGAAALVLALRVFGGDRVAASEDEVDLAFESARPMAVAVNESLEDLRGEPDARRAIVRCYARFERAAAAAGVGRSPWLTPMEFMRQALDRLSIPGPAVPTLTGLFELARFSHHPLGPPERDRALGALDDIRAVLGARDGDARG